MTDEEFLAYKPAAKPMSDDDFMAYQPGKVDTSALPIADLSMPLRLPQAGLNPQANPEPNFGMEMAKRLAAPPQGFGEKALEYTGIRPSVANIAMMGANKQPTIAEGAGMALGAVGTAVNPILAASGAVPAATLARAIAGGAVGQAVGSKFGPVGEVVGNLGGAMAGTSRIPGLAASKASQLLEQFGGKALPSADLPGMAETLGRGIEWSARGNPLTEWMMKQPDAANVRAVKGYIGAVAPQALEDTGAQSGERLKYLVSNAYDESKANYKQVLDNVKKSSFAQYNAAKEAPEKLRGILSKAAENMEYVPDDVAELVNNTASRLEKANTPGLYDMEIKRFNDLNKEKLASLNSSDSKGTYGHYFGQVNDALKDTHYENLNKVQLGLGDELRATNFDYGHSKGELYGPFGKMADGKIESLPDKMLTAGSEFHSAAAQHLGEAGYSKLQDESLGSLFRKAMDDKGNLSNKKLVTAYQDSIKKGMDWRPEQKEAIENVFDMMRKSGLQTLAEENPSGTARMHSRITQGTALGTALVTGHGIAPLAGAGVTQAMWLKAGPSLKQALQQTIPEAAGRIPAVMGTNNAELFRLMGNQLGQ